jgi:hypothetical protein
MYLYFCESLSRIALLNQEFIIWSLLPLPGEETHMFLYWDLNLGPISWQAGALLKEQCHEIFYNDTSGKFWHW